MHWQNPKFIYILFWHFESSVASSPSLTFLIDFIISFKIYFITYFYISLNKKYVSYITYVLAPVNTSCGHKSPEVSKSLLSYLAYQCSSVDGLDSSYDFQTNYLWIVHQPQSASPTLFCSTVVLVLWKSLNTWFSFRLRWLALCCLLVR